MRESPQGHRLLYRIAEAYYREGMTQQEIARRFGVSRPKVSRLLQVARDERVVQIVIVPPPGNVAELERRLETLYGLDEVVIVTVSDGRDPAGVARELGPAAADCLLRSLQTGDTVSVAWGRTLLALADALPYTPMQNVTVAQMTGGLGPSSALEHALALATRLSAKLNARACLLPAPGIMATAEAASAIRQDPQIEMTLEQAASARIALLGLGVPARDSMLLEQGQIVSTADIDLLETRGAVGDVALHFVDAHGQPVAPEMSQRVVGLSLDQIAQIPRVIGVGGGLGKRAIVQAALDRGLLDVLVTDDETAAALLQAHKASPQ